MVKQNDFLVVDSFNNNFSCFFIKNKIVIHIFSFFKKGFKLNKDSYGVYCWTGKQGCGKTYNLISFIYKLKKKNMKVITNVESFYLKNKDFVIYEPNFYNIINKFKSGEFNTNYVIFF